MLGGSSKEKLELYSMVYETFGLSIDAQKKMPIKSWYEHYEVSIKKHKQKLEWMSLR